MKGSELIKEINDGAFDSRLSELYSDMELCRIRYISALNAFTGLYGDGDLMVFSAPGRTEICGNHTDHQGGRVLAASVEPDALAVACRTDDNICRLYSEGYGSFTVDLSCTDPDPREAGTTAAFIRGVAGELKARGFSTGGFKAYITSNVRAGSGMSSSAVCQVLLGNVFSWLYNGGSVDPVTVARIGQRAENVYFGKPSGLMDQMACSVGGLLHMDFYDGSSPKIRRVLADFKALGCRLCLVDTGSSHADLTDCYGGIPREMGAVAACFGETVLSRVAEDRFYRELSAVRAKAGDRAVLRAMHFYGENRRVDAMERALASGKREEFFRLVRASGRSSFEYLQNVFSPQNPGEESLALALGLSERLLGQQGAFRVHGGGFAGTVLAFVPEELLDNYKAGMENLFGPGSCLVTAVRSQGGIRVL